MTRSLGKLATALLLAFFVVWALILMGPDFEARVQSKVDMVHVLPRSGMWYHQYTVTARRVGAVVGPSAESESEEASQGNEEWTPVAATAVDTSALERITFRVTQAQHDAFRTGARLRMHRMAFVSSWVWVVEESVILGALQALGARIVQFQKPRSVAPMLGRESGLARVVSVNRITRARAALESGGAGPASAPTMTVEVIVVEFWARRMRTLVRTADVVDARSIGDLGPGQILQMHYDPFSPRVMRLDDGMRTVVP